MAVLAEPPAAAFPERLRAFRDAKGLSQQALAQTIGVSVSLVAQMEQGRRPNPTLDTLVKLAKVFGVTVSDLVGDAPGARKGE